MNHFLLKIIRTNLAVIIEKNYILGLPMGGRKGKGKWQTTEQPVDRACNKRSLANSGTRIMEIGRHH